MLKDLAGQKLGPQIVKHRTAKQLFNIGRLAFLMMINPQDIPAKTERERREFERGYYKTKIKWIETNPLIPAFFRDADAPRTKRFFRPRPATVAKSVLEKAA